MVYTKKDYLSPTKFAKAYNMDRKLVKAAMVLADKRRDNVFIYRNFRPLVLKKSSTYHLRPETEALTRFLEICKEIENKGKIK